MLVLYQAWVEIIRVCLSLEKPLHFRYFMSMATESHEEIGHKDVVFMCYMGTERSRAIQRAYQDAGIDVGVFNGGTKRLSWMDTKDIKRELEGKFVYVIYDFASKKIEFLAKERAIDKLTIAGIGYQLVDQSALMNMASEVGRNYDDYLI